MSKKIQKAVDEVGELVDDLSSSENMSQVEAKEFFEELLSAIESRLEGIKSDLGEG